MDSIFLLDERHRASFLAQVMQSFGCVYICLWSYLPPPSNCLLALEGLYGETSNQPSLARQLFNVYRESVTYVDAGRIPGLAFKNNIPYMELKLHDFERMVSGEVQLQFYREAGIKTIVFMGCAAGEIELGIANDPQVDLEKEINNLISLQARGMPIASDLPHPLSSSSSSLCSLSMDSPECQRLSYPSTSNFVQEPLQQPLEALSQIRGVQLPTIESEDAAMTKAILTVLSSPSNSSSAAQTLLPSSLNRSTTAFTRYRASSSSSSSGVRAIPAQKQNKFKRAVLFFRNLNMRRRQELEVQENRPSVNQLHHMISERRRREKLNHSFHLLRSLLPPGSKKDKASVLSSTTEYLSSLKSEMVELEKKNQMLESQLLSARQSEARTIDFHAGSSSSAERVNVEITQVSSSTSEERFLDLRVSVRGESSLLDLITRLIEYLKQHTNLSLLSLQSNTSLSGAAHVHGVTMRLQIQGDEFDDSGFEEGVRRVADDDQAH